MVSNLAKNPYSFAFTGLTEGFSERELEDSIVANLKDFFLELGQGFSFFGQQQLLVVGDKQYHVDLLLYHQRLHRFIAIELKIGEFEFQDIGQLQGYLGIIDKTLRVKGDKRSIGLLLCKDHDEESVKYSLEGSAAPIVVARYVFQDEESEGDIKDLPSVEHINDWVEENT